MLTALASLLVVAGLPLVQAQSVYSCDGLSLPDYDNCDSIMSRIPWDDNDESRIADGACESFNDPGDTGNCIISACNDRGDGVSQPLNVFSGPTNYGLIKQWCKPDNTGGQAPVNSNWYVVAVNNPNYSPPSAAKRAAMGKFGSKVMTIEETKALWEAAKQVNADNLTPRGSALHKRASWIDLGISRNIRQDGTRSRMSAVGGSGSSTSWATTEGYSTSVTTSAEMGVNLFEIFTASVSISVTQEYSVSYTETITFDPSGRCDPAQDAVLYFYPLFDRYLGMFDDADQEYTIWVPVAGDSNYAVDVECLG